VTILESPVQSSASRVEIEEALVSFALTSPEAFDLVCSEVDPLFFEDDGLRKLYEVCFEMRDAIKTTDIPAVVLELRQRGVLGMLGGVPFLTKLASKGYFAHNVHYYMSELTRLAALSKLTSAANKLINTARLDSDPKKLLAEFEKTVSHIVAPKTRICQLAESAEEALAMQRESKETGVSVGMKTGFPALDSISGGLFRGQLALLSGRTYTGKTTLALNFAMNMARNGFRVAMHCLEMKSHELAERVMCNDASIDLQAFSTGKMSLGKMDAAASYIPEYRKLPLHLVDSLSETVTTIRGKAKYHSAKHGLDVLIIDHLQRLSKRDPRQERHVQLNEDVKDLKNLARELDCCILLLTQLKVSAKEDSEPTDDDYAEAKQIKQEADLAMMLHRKKNEQGGKLIINKVRKGGSGEVALDFNGPYQRFVDSSIGSLLDQKY
jgi:replicative DNA helicase